jgi:hypothetical protein
MYQTDFYSYAAVHEEEFLESDSLSGCHILFYRQYIDDGFMIGWQWTHWCMFNLL